MSELLANPRGCLSFAERSSSAAELMAPHETTTTSAEYVSRLPLRSTTTDLTSRPELSVSRRFTMELISKLTLGCFTASSMHRTCASALAYIRQGNPSQVLQRMQRLFCGFFSSSMTPTGTWNGLSPERAKSSCNC